MFSFGWSEIALTIVIVVIVVGPKEIPNFLRQIGKISKSFKKISREFKNSLNEITNEEDFKDIKKSITDLKDIKEEVNISKTIEKEIKSVEESVNLTNKKNENLNKEKK